MKKKTNVEDARNKIKQMFKGELIKELKSLYISNDRYGIKAFGKYRIRQDAQTNLFTVSSHNGEHSCQFINARNAMAYCVFSHNSNNEKATEVYNLDGKMASINLDIAVHTRGYKSTAKDLDHRLIQLTKLQDDLGRKKQIVYNLERLINTSKEQQRRIFEEHKKNRFKRTKNSADNDKYIISTTDY
jgi:hypothetical protein